MSKTILVVDDSPADTKLMLHALQGLGHRVLTATDGEEALSAARSELPDLILLDVILPKKNGFQVCRTLKTSPDTERIKIVFVTGKDQDPDRSWGVRQGADAYLTKPFAEAEIVENVQRLI